jgi:hypothetical protein
MLSSGQISPFTFIPQEYLQEIKQPPKKWTTYLIAIPGADQMVFSINDSKFVHHFLIDRSLKVVSRIDYELRGFEYKPERNDLQESNFSNNKFSYYYKSGTNTLIQEELDFSTGHVFFTEYLHWEKKEKYVATLRIRDKLYVITSTNHSNILKIYPEKKPFLQIELKVDSLLGVDQFAVEKSIGSSRVIYQHMLRPIELSDMAYKLKIYVDNTDHIQLTFDNLIHWTMYFDIDLNNLKHENRVFYKQTSECNEMEENRQQWIKSNSFVYNDKILQAYYCPEHIFLQVKDIRTGNILTEYHASKDSAISFANTDLIESTEYKAEFGGRLKPAYAGLDKKKELSTRKFFRRLNLIQVTAIPDNNGNIIVKLGESEPLMSGGGGGGPMMVPGGSFSTPGGTVNLPATFVSTGTGGFATKAGVSEIYFKSVFDSSFNHVDKIVPETRFDRLNQIESSVKDNVFAMSSFGFGNKLYCAYYEKESKQFLIEGTE